MPMTKKKSTEPLDGILIFGASAHIGGPLTEYLIDSNPSLRLRLATSEVSKMDSLRDQFPSAELVQCNYYDSDEIEAAFKDMEGAFVVTPDFTDEKLAMNNFVSAAEKSGVFRHLVRIIEDAADIEFAQSDMMPTFFKEVNGAVTSHNVARRILDKAPFPTTYLNIAAYYCDDLSGIWYGNPVRSYDKLVDVDQHLMAYVDPADVAQAAANIFLRRNEDDNGAFYNVHDEQERIDFSDVATIMSEELGRKITYVEDADFFRKWCGPRKAARFGDDGLNYILKMLAFEGEAVRGAGDQWPASDLSNLLGRKPSTHRQWISSDKAEFDRL